MIEVRTARNGDEDALWRVMEETIRAGETYPYAIDMTREEALALWLTPPYRCYVARLDGQIRGAYYLKPNQPSLGDHVANAGYMVHSSARRRGLGRAMGEHSIAEAKCLGYRAMQFNLVVEPNVASHELWKSLGFRDVGRLPGAFRHPGLGFVDAFVMYLEL